MTTRREAKRGGHRRHRRAGPGAEAGGGFGGWVVAALAIAALLAALPTAPGLAQQGSREEARQTAKRLAAAEAAGRIVEELEQVRPEGLTEVWSETMLSDLDVHRKTAGSRTVLEVRYREELRDLLRERLGKLHDALNPAGEGEGSFTREWLLEYVTSRRGQQVEASESANVRRFFEPVFLQARQAAIRRQLAGLQTDLRPSLEEIETLAAADWSPSSRRELEQDLLTRMGRGVRLLEEAEAELNRTAGKMIEDGQRQYRIQSAAVDHPVPEEARVAEQITRALEGEVESALLRLRMAEGPEYPVYDVFPSVRRRIEARSVELERDRFLEVCRSRPLSIDHGAIRSLFQGNLPGHRDPDESLTHAVRHFLPQVQRATEEAFTSPVPQASWRQASSDRIRRGLSEAGPFSEELRGCVRSRLAGPLQAVRREIAGTQMARYFPEVASGRFRFPERVLLSVHREEYGLTSFEECLEIELLTEGGAPLERRDLLKETEQLVLAETTKLLHEGERAWDGQLRIARLQEPEIARALRGERGRRSASEWTAHFIAQAREIWEEEGHASVWRGFSQPPAGAEMKYLALFSYVKDQIRKNVQTQFEQASQRRRDEQEASERLRSNPQTSAPRVSLRSEESAASGNREHPSEEEGQAEPGRGQGRVDAGEKLGGGFTAKLTEGIGGGKRATWSRWLLWLLLFLALLSLVLVGLLLVRSGSVRPWLVVVACGLVLAMAGLMMTSLGKLTIPVGNLDRAQRDLAPILGVPAEALDESSVVFRLGPFQRIILQEARQAAPPQEGVPEELMSEELLQ